MEIPSMGLPKSYFLYTVYEYLCSEREAKERHEYLDGKIYAMAGESGNHADITANLAGTIVFQLRGKPCRARFKDTKVRSGPISNSRQNTSGLYSYPDVVVVCGELQYHDANSEVLLNPTAIVEVLSPTTEAFDRGEKFERYKDWNLSLKDYVLVSQVKPEVELFSRDENAGWSIERYSGLDAKAFIPSIGCALKLADIYDRIIFPNG
jgi:Uma2 family endonuclease